MNDDLQTFLFGADVTRIGCGSHLKAWERRIGIVDRIRYQISLDQSYRFPFGLKWVAKLIHRPQNFSNLSLQKKTEYYTV